MMRTNAGKETKGYNPAPADSGVPRKCVIIRKKKVGENMEKIELRYVAYSRIDKGSRSTTMEAINHAAAYFRERAGDLDYQDEPSSKSTCQKTFTVVKSEEKEKKKLEQCLPILLNIRARFAENEKNKSYSIHKRNQNGALKALCDEIVEESTYVLNNGHPVSSDLIKKIANINTLSRQVIANETKMENLVQDEFELAASKSKTSDKVSK
ncbi:uncharacterized protein CELE_B0252.5 [Caenorhabditis elegans]|uniref:Uncharacterized protein B0252.5 n=1 Tax=Caenorhabditis elegans TaxID=6239 RepID=YT15_CAEEL|nr:Uncharacterized protein CELE_B0252.5 [Caenorhabditis elegans]Q10918.2 RecName: Full=Uncharacterized protein B0252.5 [Caenorhabditis elegans]CCD61543.2 Uncharacterized protein CELE_B0252.5 [Caenorhabditis elegans]